MKKHAKKAASHRLEFFGKSVPTLLVAALVVAGTGSAALLQSYGTITGETNVNAQAVDFINDAGDDNVLFYDFNSVADNEVLGQTYRQVEGVRNNANVATEVSFSSECSRDHDSSTTTEGPTSSMNIDWDNDVTSNEACDGINTRFLEYYDSAGHDFSGYSSPSSGDAQVVVSDSDDLQSKINGATSGDTVLVEPGSYSGTVEVSTSDLTIVAENAPDSTNPSTVSGAKTGFRVTATGVTIKGFEVTANPSTLSPNARGIDVQASDVTVDSNYVHNVRAEDRPIGVLVWGDQSNVDNVKVVNNHVMDVQATVLTGTAKGESKVRGIALDGDNDGSSPQYTASGANISYNTVEDIGGNGQAAMSTGINIYGGAPVDFNVAYNQLEDIDHNEDTTAFSGGPRAPAAQGVYLSGLTKSVGSGLSGVGNSVIARNNFDMTAAAVVDAQFADFTNNVDYTFVESQNYWGLDGVEVTDEAGDISSNYDYETKSTPVSLDAGETDQFGAFNSFAINLAPGTYNVTTQVLPN